MFESLIEALNFSPSTTCIDEFEADGSTRGIFEAGFDIESPNKGQFDYVDEYQEAIAPIAEDVRYVLLNAAHILKEAKDSIEDKEGHLQSIISAIQQPLADEDANLLWGGVRLRCYFTAPNEWDFDNKRDHNKALEGWEKNIFAVMRQASKALIAAKNRIEDEDS